MSFFKRLFGGGEDPETRAERLFSEGQFGPAKLAFEEALDRSSEASKREALAERIDACLDALAEARLEDAERLASNGELELAFDELGHALEVVASDALRERILAARDRLERGDAAEQAAAEELTDEERWVLLSGAWEDAQAEEYEDYGEAFVEAVLALHAGKVSEARKGLEAVLEDAEAPRYLWLELGRARVLDGDRTGAREAFVELVESMAEDERGLPLLAAYVELAKLAEEDDEHEEAVSFYQRAMEEFDEDPRPYFVFGRYLRDQELFAEAVDVLEAGANLLDEDRPDLMYLQEVGLALADAGRDADAVGTFERIVSILTTRSQTDFPPTGTERLAQLHEKQGNPQRAADLYAALARGSDRSGHFRYHREAGRLLAELGLKDEARRMWTRALALTEDAEAQATLREQLDAL
ncbi:MAG: tetratricopeptide repeat protein [Sandaracinus sp.]|nr:tetratricopeptide repeat protein [Sandaracinus sp.]MCB9632628.1 tetratricopeptide repeat protein [Sandaracinus sp.]